MENLNEMANALWLTDKVHWDLALYWIFLINLVLMMMQSEGSAFATLLGIIVLVSVVIDKTLAFGYMLEVDLTKYTDKAQCHEEVFIGTYLIRVAMFVAPLTIAGSTRNPKARGVAVLAGISGAVYMFARWYFDQRDVEITDITCAYLIPGMALQNVGVSLVLARIVLRDKLRLGTIYRDIPVTVPGDLAAHDVEVKIA